MSDDFFAYREPDLSSFADATGQQRQLAKAYTRVRNVVRPDMDEPGIEPHTCWLVVGNQYFCVGDTDNEQEASWRCWMLAKAIEKILDEDAASLSKQAAGEPRTEPIIDDPNADAILASNEGHTARSEVGSRWTCCGGVHPFHKQGCQAAGEPKGGE